MLAGSAAYALFPVDRRLLELCLPHERNGSCWAVALAGRAGNLIGLHHAQASVDLGMPDLYGRLFLRRDLLDGPRRADLAADGARGPAKAVVEAETRLQQSGAVVKRSQDLAWTGRHAGLAACAAGRKVPEALRACRKQRLFRAAPGLVALGQDLGFCPLAAGGQGRRGSGQQPQGADGHLAHRAAPIPARSFRSAGAKAQGAKGADRLAVEAAHAARGVNGGRFGINAAGLADALALAAAAAELCVDAGPQRRKAGEQSQDCADRANVRAPDAAMGERQIAKEKQGAKGRGKAYGAVGKKTLGTEGKAVPALQKPVCGIVDQNCQGLPYVGGNAAKGAVGVKQRDKPGQAEEQSRKKDRQDAEAQPGKRSKIVKASLLAQAEQHILQEPQGTDHRAVDSAEEQRCNKHDKHAEETASQKCRK